MTHHRTALPALLVAVGALTLAACGSSAGVSSTADPPTGTDSSVTKLVPTTYSSKGRVTIASDASYAPNEFFDADGKTIVGMDVDMGKALAAAMGLRVNVVNASFDSILPGLASGKYDMGISSFTDNAQREKAVDFVTYFVAGTSFFVRTQGGPNVTGLNSLCGLTVAVEKGTTQVDDAQAQSSRCEAAGKPAVNVQVFPDQAGANLALTSGRADVVMADSPLADYQVTQSHGQLKLVGQTYGTAPYGIALAKNSGLAPAVLAALEHIMADGQYTTILRKWGLTNGAITNPVINGATS